MASSPRWYRRSCSTCCSYSGRVWAGEDIAPRASRSPATTGKRRGRWLMRGQPWAGSANHDRRQRRRLRVPAYPMSGSDSIAGAPPCRADHSRKNGPSLMKTNHQWTRINTNRQEDRWTSFNHKRRQNASAILQSFALGVTMSWDEGLLGARASRHDDGFLGARASRPHQAWHSLDHLPHLDQPGTAPWLSFGLADAVPADRVAACSIALKLSGGQRDRMRAGRPRSQAITAVPSRQAADAVGGVWRATSQKADVHPLGNSRLPASRAPARPCGSFEEKRPIVIEDEPRMGHEYRWTSFNHKRHQNASAILRPWGDLGGFLFSLSVFLRVPSRTPFESFPTPWNPFTDSSFALLTDPLSPLVEIFSPLSLLQNSESGMRWGQNAPAK